MKIRELFLADVTRDIPPVIYFHEQSPEKLVDEVGEYIITGGYPPDHPHHKRVPQGIHEQFVRLLKGIASELRKKGGPELPAAWISGFYGSGKSSFAKLLGLAFDGVALPDGTSLAKALLQRDRSPLRAGFQEAWDALLKKVDPIAVVFDIGGVARDNEQIHSAVVRQVQKRLGYCSTEPLVSDFELKLERDGHWQRFLEAAEKSLGRPWAEAKDKALAEDDFSHVLHELFPDRYTDPLSWIETRAGTSTRTLAPEEAVQAIDDMLKFRADGKTLFLVIDEVSQYIHQNDQRMLRLQSFVSELGQRLKGKVWLLVTGQEKLEDERESSTIGKMKGRFPPQLRVHLAATNIRDVVHRRLLQKSPEAEKVLRAEFQKYRSNLKLYAYGCEHVTEEDFIEVYPMLPGHIDLLLQITSALRTRSTRVQGDDHAIRGLLQLLGELFREQRLAERDMGELVTLDAIFEVQQSALDSDVQTTLARIFEHCAQLGDDLAARAARAVALLELIQDQVPTDAKFVASCLYAKLSDGDRIQAVTDALERLRQANLLGYSEKHGYKIQSSAGQEWERERQDIGITPEQRSEFVQEALKFLLGSPDRPKLDGVPFPWGAWYSDGRGADDVKLQDARSEAAVVVDFRFVAAEERNPAQWIKRSADKESPLYNRLVWVAGQTAQLQSVAGELGRSRRMLERYKARRESLTRDKQRLLLEEETRSEDLDKKLRETAEAAWMSGRVYFRGQEIDPAERGGSFATALQAIATGKLPELFPSFVSTAVTEAELLQLLEKNLSGVSSKFLEGSLGILTLDAGRYDPTCKGSVPARILQYVQQNNGTSGSSLFSYFAGPPFGHSPGLVRACLAGLLRGGMIRIRPEDGPEITSIGDPDVKQKFTQDRPLRRADLFPAGKSGVEPRDRIAICRFFEDRLDVRGIERENEAIADAVYQHFPHLTDVLRQVKDRLGQLPGPPPVPPALQKLEKSLEDCRRSRQVELTVQAVKRHLDVLNDGVQRLRVYEAELKDAVLEKVRRVHQVRVHHLGQLEEAGALDGALKEASARIQQQLVHERPWQAIDDLNADLEAVLEAYHAERKRLLQVQEQQAEQVRVRLKASRPAFEKLTADQKHRVLRPISEARTETTPEATAPSLHLLQTQFQVRLRAAEEEANERLDEILSVNEPGIVKVQLGLKNKVVASPADLEVLLADLRDRIGLLLAKGNHVRLV